MTVVMSSCSRACVHSADAVYMALPSASSASTGRSGQAIAAPAASGRPWPIAPPVSVSQSCGGAPRSRRAGTVPEVFASSQTMAPSGSSAPITAAALSRGQLAVRQAGPRLAAAATASVRRDEVRQRGQRAGYVVTALGQHVHLTAVRHQVLGLPG